MRNHTWVILLSLVLAVAGAPSTVALAQQERLTPEAQMTPEDGEQELLQQQQVLPFVVQQVAVECNGNCNDSRLRDLCDEGWTPIAVDCQNVQEPQQAISNTMIVSCGGNNRCSRFLVLGID